MADEFKISDDLAARISSLASEVGTEARELRDQWDEKSDRWQEGEEGNDVLSWIDELDDLAETLDTVLTKPK